MLSLIGTLSTALALANTAPFLLVSGQKELPSVNGADISTLEESLSASLEGCGWDAYVFAHIEGVSERNINADTMPQLQQLIDKSFAHRSLPAVTNFDSYTTQAEKTVRASCGAKDVSVNADGSFELYEDSEPRLLEAKLGSDPAKADEILSHIVGHLTSGNFLLVLRTSPPDQASQKVVVAEDEKDKNKTSNLFTDYVFFSPGIFMAILISALAASVLFIALGWLNSLKVSYKAFEKQPEKSG